MSADEAVREQARACLALLNDDEKAALRGLYELGGWDHECPAFPDPQQRRGLRRLTSWETHEARCWEALVDESSAYDVPCWRLNDLGVAVRALLDEQEGRA